MNTIGKKRFISVRNAVSAVLIAVMAISMSVSFSSSADAQRKLDEKTASLVKQFEYDHSMPLNTEEKFIMKTPSYSQYHLLFDSVNGERIPGVLYMPTKPAASYPCIIVQHGYNGDKSMGGTFSAFLVPRGYAVIAIDIEYHGERKEEGRDILSTDIENNARAMKQTVIDLMRTVDYLKSRGDIDMDRIGYIGASLGSFLGAVFTGMDERVKSVLLVVGGGDWEEMIGKSQVPPFNPIRDMYAKKGLSYSDYDAKMDIVEPLNYIGLLSPRPLLMVNCANDKFVPKVTGEKLFAAAGETKQIEWFTCDGDIAHIPPMDKSLALAKKWFKKTLGQ